VPFVEEWVFNPTQTCTLQLKVRHARLEMM